MKKKYLNNTVSFLNVNGFASRATWQKARVHECTKEIVGDGRED